ncbi:MULTISPECIES: NAD(P)-dependent oxidoreductase [unclassified Variovorax]|uniref:NAD-dependent epimerase/dehydratase family protein n=1 Tax=unclassified Variovorax TaxID=663243 RepID=UPI00076D30B9|nr:MULTISPECIES: NAD(P)-dependent oxidoreductase [unclassified Variovorax]KWT82691.1 UDP-glucose 4-epimerase [Variovorax sp. WDL1]PNG59494.1 dTDP-6-deoxy-L-talose 4-dehydrogenase (NAD(+)) [Variovorax sp. B4]PNG60715.1 dTDP-6-deoxy-L-talose 4-dehydrogenase (NAD(+)) [Variovorax sp. B2]VTV13377.1 GDP-6-deoxy-D-mannose reductase [Variovorax sp. WDL1]
MRIAVTGASGFVGRHVLRAVAEHKDVEVVAVSRRPPGAWLPSGMRHVAFDLTAPPPDVFAALGQPDVLIHLAWSGLPNYLSRHHYETHLAEQYRFLKLLAAAGLPSLLCAGTCFEYGMRSGELHESLPPDPRNPYGFAKDALRRELEFLAADLGFKLSWARLFYMYGEGQAPGSLYSQFMAAGSTGAAEFPMSGGEQLRDFLHVTEVARRLVRLACEAPGAGIVNVCSGQPTSVRALVEGWLQIHRWPMKLALGHYAYPAYEPMAFWGSGAKLTRLLGPT